MPRFSDLAKESRRITFDFLGTPITLDYSPTATTGKMMRRMDALMLDGARTSGLDASYEFLIATVSWWDVKEDDDKTMFPLDPKRLDELPTEFIHAVVENVSQDAQEKKAQASRMKSS